MTDYEDSRVLVADEPIKSGETKTLSFTIGGDASLSGATFKFTLSDQSGENALFSLEGTEGDSDTGQWDFSGIDSSGRVATVTLTPTETAQTPDWYFGEVKITYSGGAVEKSPDLKIEIQRAIT